MQTLLMKRGEIWLVSLDPAVGSESRKTRPGIIVSNDSANKNLQRVLVVPVTSAVGTVYPGEFKLEVESRQAKAMCDQLRALDKRRLLKKLDSLSPAELKRLDDALCTALALPL